MTVVPEGGGLKKALRWVVEERLDHPETSRLTLVDQAGMRFNLSPKESDALLRMLKAEKENTR